MRAVEYVARAAAALAIGFASATAGAHSASDAYLTLTRDVPATGASSGTLVHAQWDIALRDLDFVLQLDEAGDGNIVWREVREHQAAIFKYALGSLRASGEGEPCALTPVRLLVDRHADGAYAALFFDIACKAAPKRLTLDYRLFFSVDPSHRGILVMRSGAAVTTALLSPDNARIELAL